MHACNINVNVNEWHALLFYGLWIIIARIPLPIHDFKTGNYSFGKMEYIVDGC